MPGPAPLLQWKQHVLSNGVHLDVLDEPNTGIDPESGTTMLVSSFSPVRVGLWHGTGDTLAEWRTGVGKNTGIEFGSETKKTICGRPARKLQATTPDGPPIYVLGSNTEEAQASPAETYVAVAFEHAGESIVAFYVVATAKRDEYADDEKHFFASIICPDA